MRSRFVGALVVALGLALAPLHAQIAITYTFVNGTVADATQVNSNFSTLANDALNRTGGTMTGALLQTAGSASAPGLAIVGDTGTGILQPGTHNWAVALNGTQDLLLDPTSGFTLFGVNLVNSSGKIPALSSTYFASLDASALTNVGPSGMIAFFAGGSCPSGWTEYTALRGRYPVGLVSGGTNAATVGTALTNTENRAGSASLGVSVGTGSLSASATLGSMAASTSITVPYNHGGAAVRQSIGDTVISTSTVTGNMAGDATTSLSGAPSVSISGAPSVSLTGLSGIAGTTAPYIQLIACEKS